MGGSARRGRVRAPGASPGPLLVVAGVVVVVVEVGHHPPSRARPLNCFWKCRSTTRTSRSCGTRTCPRSPSSASSPRSTASRRTSPRRLEARPGPRPSPRPRSASNSSRPRLPLSAAGLESRWHEIRRPHPRAPRAPAHRGRRRDGEGAGNGALTLVNDMLLHG